MYHYTESGLQNIWLTNGHVEKDTPYGKGVGIHNVEGLHKAIGLHIVQNKPRLAGAEVRFIRKYLDMSQAELAGILGVGDTSIRGWENHRNKITKPADRLLRVLFLEHIKDNGKVRAMIERIANMNRDAYHKKLQFSKEEDKWKAAA